MREVLQFDDEGEKPVHYGLVMAREVPEAMADFEATLRSLVSGFSLWEVGVLLVPLKLGCKPPTQDYVPPAPPSPESIRGRTENAAQRLADAEAAMAEYAAQHANDKVEAGKLF
ncbi:MAG: hypothetical protein ABSE73_14200, partial [Planctomycetota bacterium]